LDQCARDPGHDGSGWQIYDASPLFGFHFSKSIALGQWLGGALLWHFAAMWVLVINGIVYVTLGLATGRFRRKLLPIAPSQVVADVRAALTFKLAHDDLSHYNSVQKLLYTGVILCGVLIVLSGLSIWKPVQFQELTALFGGYDFARYVHFFAMAAIVGFLIVHVALALLAPKSLRAMIVGK
jgi:thiosulfate reductase cytochrome b subunit